MQSDVDYYKTTYGRHQGATAIGAYDLRTLDGGKNWYAVKAKGGEVVILGEAEKVYPGLLASIEGLAALIDYVDKNGPIGSRPITESDLKVLSGAGFTVTKK